MNYIIVDDEPQARTLLRTYMSGLLGYHLVKLCANAIEAYEVLHTAKVDLMFLDIKMPVLSGTEFLRSLQNPPLVIFTTAYNKYALEGYELNVIDYLLKPIALPRLLQALEKAMARSQQRELVSPPREHLFVKFESKLIRVDLADLLMVEGMQNYVKLHFSDKILVASYTMKELESLLPAEQFMRVHRSFIISLKSIKSFHGNVIETTYRDVAIGMSYKNAVMRYVNNEV